VRSRLREGVGGLEPPLQSDADMVVLDMVVLMLARRMWLVNALAAAVCATLLGHAAGGWVRGGLPRPPPPLRSPAPASAIPADRIAPEAIAARNIFCSTCAPPGQPAADTGSDGSPRRTQLPLSLVAVNLIATSWARAERGNPTAATTDSGGPASSVTLRHVLSQQVGVFSLGGSVLGAVITRISEERIELERDGAREFLDFSAAMLPEPDPPSAAPAPPAGDALGALLQRGIRQTGEHAYEIDRAALQELTSNLNGIARTARLLPEMLGGRPAGFRVIDLQPGSPLTRIGLDRGDVLTAINGLELTSVEKTMEVYLKLKSASQLSLTLDRGGRQLIKQIHVR
jgi:type II secretion system protein C